MTTPAAADAGRQECDPKTESNCAATMQVMAGLITRIVVAAALIAGGLSFTATAKADDPPNERGFIEATSGLPMYVMPSRILTDENILAGGYRACAVMDQYPTESRTAAVVYFHGG